MTHTIIMSDPTMDDVQHIQECEDHAHPFVSLLLYTIASILLLIIHL